MSPFYRGRVNVSFLRPPQDADSHLGGADADDGRREPRQINPAAQHRLTALRGGWLGKPWPSPSRKEAAWPRLTSPVNAPPPFPPPSTSTTAQSSPWAATWEPGCWSRAPGTTCTGKTRSARSTTTEPTLSSGECFPLVQVLICEVRTTAFSRV